MDFRGFRDFVGYCIPMGGRKIKIQRDGERMPYGPFRMASPGECSQGRISVFPTYRTVHPSIPVVLLLTPKNTSRMCVAIAQRFFCLLPFGSWPSYPKDHKAVRRTLKLWGSSLGCCSSFAIAHLIAGQAGGQVSTISPAM